jgi:hypothetical protein
MSGAAKSRHGGRTMNRRWLVAWVAVPLALAAPAYAAQQVEANRVAEIALVSE